MRNGHIASKSIPFKISLEYVFHFGAFSSEKHLWRREHKFALYFKFIYIVNIVK